MEIRRMPVKDLQPAEYNPRRDLKPGDREYEALRRSIEEFDLVEPLIWNKRTGRLVGGHQRLKVLQARGDTEVEVSVVDLDEEREKALNVALNKVQGEWDEEKLADLLQDLAASEEVDVALTGFSPKEIDRLLAELEDGKAARENPGVEEWVTELAERHDYIVLYFDNELDRLKAWQVLGIKEGIGLRWGKRNSVRQQVELGLKRLGVGRIIRGAPVIEFLAQYGYKAGEDHADRDTVAQAGGTGGNEEVGTKRRARRPRKRS